MISAHSKTHFPAPFLCWNWLHHWRCTPYLHAAVSQSHPWKSDAVSTLLNSPTESLYNNEAYPGESTDPLWCTCLTEGQWGIARGKHWPSVMYLESWSAPNSSSKWGMLAASCIWVTLPSTALRRRSSRKFKSPHQNTLSNLAVTSAETSQFTEC